MSRCLSFTSLSLKEQPSAVRVSWMGWDSCSSTGDSLSSILVSPTSPWWGRRSLESFCSWQVGTEYVKSALWESPNLSPSRVSWMVLKALDKSKNTILLVLPALSRWESNVCWRKTMASSTLLPGWQENCSGSSRRMRTTGFLVRCQRHRPVDIGLLQVLENSKQMVHTGYLEPGADAIWTFLAFIFLILVFLMLFWCIFFQLLPGAPLPLSDAPPQLVLFSPQVLHVPWHIFHVPPPSGGGFMSGVIKSLLVEKQHIVLVGTVVSTQQQMQSETVWVRLSMSSLRAPPKTSHTVELKQSWLRRQEEVVVRTAKQGDVMYMWHRISPLFYCLSALGCCFCSLHAAENITVGGGNKTCQFSVLTAELLLDSNAPPPPFDRFPSFYPPVKLGAVQLDDRVHS